ncbi:MAG: DUF1697 domain-containing protein [Rhodoglobus sp.]
MSRFVALVRGINVGPTTTVSMAVLREVVEAAGATDVRTLLNSGNVVFSASTAPSAITLERALVDTTGVVTRVVIMDAPRFRRIVEAMPFEGDLSRLTLGFMDAVPAQIQLPDPAQLAPEQFQLTDDACYQSLPDGVSQTKLKPSFWKQFPPETTVRNLRTARKIIDLF